jgi:hypothetical protein
MIPVDQEIRARIDKFAVQIKSFCTAKEINCRVRRKPTE